MLIFTKTIHSNDFFQLFYLNRRPWIPQWFNTYTTHSPKMWNLYTKQYISLVCTLSVLAPKQLTLFDQIHAKHVFWLKTCTRIYSL